MRKPLFGTTGTVLWSDLINPNKARHSPLPRPDPTADTEIPDNLAMLNFKENCMGNDANPENFLQQPHHYNHEGSLKTRTVVGNRAYKKTCLDFKILIIIVMLFLWIIWKEANLEIIKMISTVLWET